MNACTLKKLVRRLFVMMLAVISTFIFTASSFALTAKAEDAAIGFYIKAQIPENQIDDKLSYFDLLMQPKQRQTLVVEIHNTGEEKITVDINAVSASTNQNGVIDYQTPNIRDETLRFPFSEISTVKTKELVIPAKSMKPVEIDIKMPDETFDGVILGGIYITKRVDTDTNDNTNDDAGGFQLINQFSYALGVKLTETDKAVYPDFEMISAGAEIVDNLPKYVLSIRNKEAAIAKYVKLTSRIYNKSKTSTLLEKSVDNVDMAPNSVINYGMHWTDGRLPGGDFVAYLKLEQDGRVWEFETPFTVKGDTANDINDNAVIGKPAAQSIPWWAVLLIILLSLVILIMIIFFIIFAAKRRRRDD